jgi:hypothetical protein
MRSQMHSRYRSDIQAGIHGLGLFRVAPLVSSGLVSREMPVNSEHASTLVNHRVNREIPEIERKLTSGADLVNSKTGLSEWLPVVPAWPVVTRVVTSGASMAGGNQSGNQWCQHGRW